MPRLEPGLRRVMTAGNTAALAILLALLAGLGTPRAPAGRAAATSAPPERVADRVLLIVVDGLRVDTAGDAALMPFTAALAARHGLGAARVENLLPSTIAGITTLVTGRPSPPLDFLQDFAARPSADGGIFGDVAAAGGRSFVAGPALYGQRFGRWIAAAHGPPTVFGSPDGPLVEAAVGALSERGAGGYRLVVVHLSETDEAAHEHGIDSPEYRAAIGRADDAVGQLCAAAGGGTAILITSDHGTARGGGHAGPEPDVLATPLITAGPGLPRPGRALAVAQRDVRRLVGTALGLSRSLEGPAADGGGPGASPLLGRWTGWLLPAVGLLAGVRFLAALAGTATGRPHGTALNVAVWLALLLHLLGYETVALLVAAGALVAAAVSPAARAAPVGLLAVPVSLGLVAGALRLLDALAGCGSQALAAAAPVLAAALALPPLVPLLVIGPRLGVRATVSGMAMTGEAATPLRSGETSGAVGGAEPAGPPRARRSRSAIAAVPVVLALAGAAAAAGGSSLAAACAVAFAVGRATARLLTRTGLSAPDGRRPWVAAGALLACASPAIGRALGQTLSLSTVDVHAAFPVAAGPLGLAGAVAVALFALAAVPLALVLGFAPAVGRAGPRAMGALAAGAGAALAGQAAVSAGVLLWPAAGQVTAALALGGALRPLIETFYLFAAMAAARAAIVGVRTPAVAPAARTANRGVLMPRPCNIDARGKRARLVAGLVLVAWAAVLCAIWAIPVGGVLAWGVAGACVAGGGLLIYEGRTGWCALRAMGVRTPI